jgi:hypothetical protein
MKPRRLKIFPVSADAIICYFHAWRDHDHIALPYLQSIREIPKNAKVHDAFYCPERMAICFKVEHDSFDLIPPGKQIPYADLSTMTVKIADMYFNKTKSFLDSLIKDGIRANEAKEIIDLIK